MQIIVLFPGRGKNCQRFLFRIQRNAVPSCQGGRRKGIMISSAAVFDQHRRKGSSRNGGCKTRFIGHMNHRNVLLIPMIIPIIINVIFQNISKHLCDKYFIKPYLYNLQLKYKINSSYKNTNNTIIINTFFNYYNDCYLICNYKIEKDLKNLKYL